MKISEFSEYLQKLENTSKRLEITAILKDLIKSLSKTEIDKGMYLALGTLDAQYKTPKFNIADKLMLRILESTYGTERKTIDKLYSELGDVGDVAFKLAKTAKADLSITEVYEALLDIAKVEGSGSQDLKILKGKNLLIKLDQTSAKFMVRTILGTTRLGFTELTIIDALSSYLEKGKELSEQIEEVYSTHPEIGLLAKRIKEHGIEGLKDLGIEPGTPILAQKCQRLTDPEEIIEKMGSVWVEYKFDGTRVQLHMNKEQFIKDAEVSLFESNPKERYLVKTFTRNLEETTNMYPDIIEAAKRQINATSVILDGEAIGYNKKTGDFLPFQEIMQRKRKHGIAEMAKDIPLKYFVFDILFLNGKDLTKTPLIKRRELLKNIITDGDTIVVDSHLETSNAEELQEFFEEAKVKNLEGIIVKKPDSPYQAGARSYSWIKWKKMDTKMLNDTVDCVVLGYYFGKGVRAQYGIGGFLVGIYDETSQTFKTITKIGTGLKEDDWLYLKKEADKIKIKEKPGNVDSHKMFYPDVWVTPKIVVEIAADEISKSPSHTAGYALRFPRLITFRTDKKATDATSVAEIITLHKKQKRGYY